MQRFSHQVALITGSSRGIGREIAINLARQGATVIITGKSSVPHPKLPGTIHTVVDEITTKGGKAKGFKLDVRDENQIQDVVNQVVEEFGGIDLLINNASAIQMTNTLETPMKRFDLMMSVNMRATFACSQACIPHLAKSNNPHILNLSPPLNMDNKWLRDHTAYTMSKYGMSMCTLGMAAELKDKGISVNSLWPRTTIATMAIKVHFPETIWQASRTPAIVADAAAIILAHEAPKITGNFFIDEDVLRQAGQTDLDKYAVTPGTPLFTDLFIDES